MLSRFASRTRPAWATCAVLLLAAPYAVADKAEDQFNFATGLFIEADYELAAAEYRAFLKRYSRHALAGKAQFQLGESLMRLERFKEAIPHLESYVGQRRSERANVAAARFRLGKAYASIGEHVKAAEHYGTFAREFPDHKLAPAARYWEGECLLRDARAGNVASQKFEKARRALESAAQQNRGTTYEPYCIYGLASSLLALGNHDAAARRFDDIVRRFSKEEFASDAALRLAQCYDKLGRHDEALAGYARLGREFGDKLAVESLMGQAWAHYHKGDRGRAAALFCRIADQHSEHSSACVAGYNAGTTLFNLGNYGDSLARFAAVTEKHGEYERASLYWRAMCLLKLDRAGEALGPLRTVASEEGQYQVEALFALGDAFYQLRKLEEAERAYEKMAAMFFEEGLADDALEAAATAASERGANDRAFTLANRLVQHYPSSPLKAKAQFLAGESLFREEKFADAARVFDEMLASNSPDVGRDTVLYKLAWCRARTGDLSAASDIFQRVAKEHADSKLAGESLYMAGKLLSDQKRHEEARAVYEECAKRYPRDPAGENAAYGVALADYSRQKWREASAGFEAFVRKFPKSQLLPDAWFYLAESRFAKKLFGPAREAYKTAARKYRDSPLAARALYGAAWCAREQGDMPNAAAAFALVADSHPKDALAGEALYWAGQCWMSCGEWARARTVLTRARSAPGVEKVAAEVHYATGHCLLREEKHDEAISVYGKFLMEFKDSSRRANALYDMAWAYLGKQDRDRANYYFQQAANEAPDAQLKGDALFRVAEARYVAEEYEKAVELYAQVGEMDGVGFADKALYKLGWSYEKLGKRESAINAYRRASELNREDALSRESAYRTAMMLKELGRHGDAVSTLTALLSNPDLEKSLAAKARFHQAESLRAAKRWADGLDSYRMLMRPNTGFEPVYYVQYGAGVCALQLSAFADARTSFEKVIEQTDTETAARAQLALGEILAKQGKHAEAAREFLKAHILYGYPKWQATGLLRAAQSFEEVGQKERATKYLKQLIEKFPDSDEADEARKLVGG